MDETMTADIKYVCATCGVERPKPGNGHAKLTCEACKAARRKAYIETYRAQNHEKTYAPIRAWHAAHPDRVREIKRKYRAKNWEEEKRKAREANLLPENRAKKRARLNEWRAKNPEKERAYQAKRYRQLKAVGGRLADADAKRIYRDQCGKCAEPTCKASIAAGYHVDHIMPLVLGGTNDPSNIQLLCPSCNVRKNAKHPIDWAQLNGRLF